MQILVMYCDLLCLLYIGFLSTLIPPAWGSKRNKNFQTFKYSMHESKIPTYGIKKQKTKTTHLIQTFPESGLAIASIDKLCIFLPSIPAISNSDQ